MFRAVLIFTAFVHAAVAVANYPDKYNLIDVSPSCIDRGLCPHLQVGGDASIHPNPNERSEYLMRNIARLQPQDYLTSAYGKFIDGNRGSTTTGGAALDAKGNPTKTKFACEAAAQTHPFYWLSEANQVTRAHQYWRDGCSCADQPTSNCLQGKPLWEEYARNAETDICLVRDTWKGKKCWFSPHDTCPDFCNILHEASPPASSRCGYVTRTRNFVSELGLGNPGGEGLWGMNVGYPSKGHCGLVFNPDLDFMGIGWWPETSYNQVTMVGIGGGAPFEDHALPHGVHFDERDRIHSDDRDANGKYLSFMVEFHGKKKSPSVSAQNVYLLYDGNAHQMSRVFGSTSSGFYRLNFGTAGITSCKPYAFFAKDNRGGWHRLPEDERYFFATHSSELAGTAMTCATNHYFKRGNSWRSDAADEYNGGSVSSSLLTEINALVSAYTSKGAGASSTVVTTTTKPPTKAPTSAAQSVDCGGVNRADCVQFSQMLVANGYDFNGQWSKGGCSGGDNYYTQTVSGDVWYLCLTSGRWIMTTKLCSLSDRRVHCNANQNRLEQCRNNMKVKKGSKYTKDSTVTITGCTSSAAAMHFFDPDTAGSCGDGMFDDVSIMCLNNSNAEISSQFWWGERHSGFGFEFYVHSDLCYNNRHVYHYTIYNESQSDSNSSDLFLDSDSDSGLDLDITVEAIFYLFWNNNATANQWVISREEISLQAVIAVCEEDNLLHCTDGAWRVLTEEMNETTTESGNLTISTLDYEVVESVDDSMAVSACAYMQAASGEGDTKRQIVWIAAILCILVLVIVVCVCVVMHCKKKRGKAEFREKVQGDEIEVEMDENEIDGNRTTTH